MLSDWMVITTHPGCVHIFFYKNVRDSSLLLEPSTWLEACECDFVWQLLAMIHRRGWEQYGTWNKKRQRQSILKSPATHRTPTIQRVQRMQKLMWWETAGDLSRVMAGRAQRSRADWRDSKNVRDSNAMLLLLEETLEFLKHGPSVKETSVNTTTRYSKVFTIVLTR